MTTEPAFWSPQATMTEAHEPRARALQQEKPLQWEAHTPQLESSLHSPQLEKPHMKQQGPSTAKNKIKINLKIYNFSAQINEALCFHTGSLLTENMGPENLQLPGDAGAGITLAKAKP